MDARWIVSLPAAPPSVVEWEDLLVRMEVMTRALAVTLEEAPADRAGAAELLRGLVDREAGVGEWLQAAAEARGGPVPTPGPVGSDAQREDPEWLAGRFVSLRARNFAMLQRRGLEVWEWVAEHQGAPVTAYQMVTALVRSDAAALEALREGRRLGQGAC